MMMKPLNAVVHRALGLFVALAMILPAEVWAQAAPSPQLRNSPRPWMGMVIMMVLAAAVVGVSMIPSKRGHQD